jgi:hypothetical protein
LQLPNLDKEEFARSVVGMSYVEALVLGEPLGYFVRMATLLKENGSEVHKATGDTENPNRLLVKVKDGVIVESIGWR